MNYEVGKRYIFQFKERYVGKDGNVYLSLRDPSNPDTFISVKPYSFQIDWDDISTTMECYCRTQDAYGNYRFELSRDYILNYLYGPYLGHYNEFTIEKRIDTGNQSNCCIISDVYGVSQRYYTKDKQFWETHKVEDSILLEVKRIHPSIDGNNAYLELEPHVKNKLDAEEDAVELTDKVIRNESMESIGVEDDHTEFKSSIAFPAGETKEDMTAQLAVLMKTIAGFMNKDGGTLYIGVNDSGEPYKDIKEEYQYLNDDETDNYKYNASQDHYKLKLINKIGHDLGNYATIFVNISFKQANGVTYAAITAKKADSIIWYRNSELYVRCDNSTRRMFGDSITNYIVSRVDKDKFTSIVNQPIPLVPETDPEPTSPQTAEIIAMKPKSLNKEEKAWRYITLFKTGQWWLSKTPYINKDELITEVPVPQNPKSHVMMVAYASGRVNAVDLKDLLYGTGRNKNTLIACDNKKSNGLQLGNDTIVNVFCMKKGGLVLMESATTDGKIRIKAHQMEVVVTHNLISAQGNKMQKEGILLRIAPVEPGTAEMDAICAMGILVKDYERYSKNGVNKAKLQGKYQELIDKILR